MLKFLWFPRVLRARRGFGSFAPSVCANSFLTPHSKACELFEAVESEAELMLDSIHREETAPYDLDKRSLYFSVDESNPLRLFPGSWLQVYYKNSKSSPTISQFGGVLLSLHDNWINSKFTLLGVIDEVAVMMQFCTFSPLISSFVIHRRATPTRTMEYLWTWKGTRKNGDQPDLALLRPPTDAVLERSAEQDEYNAGISNLKLKEFLLKHDERTGKRTRRKQVEEISVQTAGLELNQRIRMKLAEEVPPGFNKRWDSDEVERYTEDLVHHE